MSFTVPEDTSARAERTPNQGNATPVPVPEQGQLVEVRRRPWLVKDVHPGALDRSGAPHHRVTLESVEHTFGADELQVIWEREIHKEVFGALELPAPRADGWDPLKRFEAFLLATRWSLASVLESLPLQAPFKGAIEPEDYQLEPVVRALAMPRVNLLIADFVGAGKTIEAGLVIQELIARQRVRRVLIVCPASLQIQWAEEMEQKFALAFEIVDRDYVQRLRREYGIHVNPWASHPRLITSMDFLKRTEPMATFRANLQSAGRGRAGLLRDWDLLIVDEAHNLAPAGRKAYVRDSDRTQMIREVLPHCEHRLFLTATPHNGFTESFTALLEMLDPLRFSRGPVHNRETFEQHRDAIMIRRVKDDIVDDLGRRRFPRREVDPALAVTLSGKEKQLADLLDEYTALRSARGSGSTTQRHAVRFTLTLLKKRLLSSPEAFRQSIEVHATHLQAPQAEDEAGAEGPPAAGSAEQPAGSEAPAFDEPTADERARELREYVRRAEEDQADDEEKARAEELALERASTFFDATPEEHQLVARMRTLANDLAPLPDTKIGVLIEWIRGHLTAAGAAQAPAATTPESWTRDRLVVFTEYRDTLAYLGREFDRLGWSDRVLRLSGGMSARDREAIKRAFRADPDEDAVRILLATDAASEGLNLQEHCRYLIHYEIPWNPNKMEQRNGRIDRHGQPHDAVYCLHFAYTNHEDQRFLDVIVDKVRTQRDDLGAVGEIVAQGVARCMLREDDQVREQAELSRQLRRDLYSEARSGEALREIQRRRVRELRDKLRDARETWRLTPEHMAQVLDEALRLEGHPGLRQVNEGPLAGQAWELVRVPWPECRRYLVDEHGARRKLVFPEALGRDDPLHKRKDIVLVHLDHPLMRRALTAFRARLWSFGGDGDRGLSRVSYMVVADQAAERIHLVAVSRLVATNGAGHKVHEEIVLSGGAIRQTGIDWVEQERLERLLAHEGTHPEITQELGLQFRRLFPAHKRLLEERIAETAREAGERIRKRLREQGTQVAREIRGLMDQRLAEIDARLRKAAEEARDAGEAGGRQAAFDFMEREQYEDDLRWLERRREELKRDREREPEEARARFLAAADGIHAFPVALVYVLPQSEQGVLGRRDRGGVVTHSELYDLLGTFERLVREAVGQEYPGGEWRGYLSPGRIEKAQTLQAQKETTGERARLLDCLNAADYATILTKSEALRPLIQREGESRRSIERRLNALETVRNKVMHHATLAESEEELAKVRGFRDDLAALVDHLEAELARGDAR